MVCQWCLTESVHRTWFMAMLNVCRGVSGFRAFDTTRYYIRLILQSLSSTSSFLLIFIYKTFSFGLLNAISNCQLSFASLWIDSFDLAFGGGSKDSRTLDLVYVTYLTAIVLNVILMLSMIISILGDSFDEFQLYAIYYDNKEMTQVILEIEEIAASLLNPKDLKMYLHTCTNYYKPDENTWQGKVIDVRAVVQGI